LKFDKYGSKGWSLQTTLINSTCIGAVLRNSLPKSYKILSFGA
jgi:hypothetical protein